VCSSFADAWWGLVFSSFALVNVFCLYASVAVASVKETKKALWRRVELRGDSVPPRFILFRLLFLFI